MDMSEKEELLDWLKNMEDCMLWDLGVSPGDQEISICCRRNLRKIRNLKQIVNESYRWDEEEK
jgi:hypothetical protein